MFSKLRFALLLVVFATAHAEEIDDPLQPPELEAKSSQSKQAKGPVPLYVNSILIGSDRRVAVINGRLFREGDRISGYVIEKIHTNKVELSHEGKTRLLSLNYLDIKENE